MDKSIKPSLEDNSRLVSTFLENYKYIQQPQMILGCIVIAIKFCFLIFHIIWTNKNRLAGRSLCLKVN